MGRWGEKGARERDWVRWKEIEIEREKGDRQRGTDKKSSRRSM